MDEEFRIEDTRGFSLGREIFDWAETGITAVVCMVLIFTFAARMVGVDGSSMEPTLHNQDRLITSRMFYSPQQGDIVVVTKPNDHNYPLIKRIVAVGGQVVDIDVEAHTVSVDGHVLEEPYIAEPTATVADVQYPITVPDGHVFVMGDNRNNSLDSRWRDVGMIDERYILGKIYYRVLPYSSMGKPA